MDSCEGYELVLVSPREDQFQFHMHSMKFMDGSVVCLEGGEILTCL